MTEGGDRKSDGGSAPIRFNEAEAPSSISKGAYEQWFHYPEGADGPIFMRMQRWSLTMNEKWCSWLQNADANYYYHAGENRIYVTNHRL